MVREKKKVVRSKRIPEKKLYEMTEDILDKVENFSDSPEDILEMANFMEKYHNYSFRNAMLIEQQWPGATAIASYKRWEELGYKVKEKAKIGILTPAAYTLFIKPDGSTELLKNATKEERKLIEQGKLETKKGRTFKTGYVFDITQTNVPLEDYPNIFPNRHYNFDGDPEKMKLMREGLGNYARKMKLPVYVDNQDVLGSAKGAFMYNMDEQGNAIPGSEKILMNPRNTDSESVQVLIHELAHGTLHNPLLNKEYDNKKITTVEQEFQAELTSYIVCKHYGIDTSEEAVPYIARWTENMQAVADRENSLAVVQRTAGNMIATIDNTFDSLEVLSELEKQENEQTVASKAVENEVLENNASAVSQQSTDKRQKFKEDLKEILEEDETMAIGNPDELIYQIDDIKVYGGYMDGMRGVDHNVLKFEDVEWEEIMTWGTLVVPENKVYFSDTEIEELDSLGMQRQPLSENHKVNLSSSKLASMSANSYSMQPGSNMETLEIDEYIKVAANLNENQLRSIQNANDIQNEKEALRMFSFSPETEEEKKIIKNGIEIHETNIQILEKRGQEVFSQLSEDEQKEVEFLLGKTQNLTEKEIVAIFEKTYAGKEGYERINAIDDLKEKTREIYRQYGEGYDMIQDIYRQNQISVQEKQLSQEKTAAFSNENRKETELKKVPSEKEKQIKNKLSISERKKLIEDAKKVDILDFARSEGFEFQKDGRKTYRNTEHGSLLIDIEKNSFHWNAQSLHGDIIKFAQEVCGYEKFDEALLAITNKDLKDFVYVEKPKQDFVYNKSEESKDFSNARNYLVNERKINEQLVDELHRKGYIKQDKRGNVLFLWKDKNKIVGVSEQGTIHSDRFPRGSWKHIQEDSDCKHAFNFTIGKPQNLKFFESEIDALSYLTLHPDTQNTRFVGMNGLREAAIEHHAWDAAKEMKALGEKEKINFSLCIDNDNGGKNFLNDLSKKDSLVSQLDFKKELPMIPKEAQNTEKWDWNALLKFVKKSPEVEVLQEVEL